jgi:hypothetical protein
MMVKRCHEPIDILIGPVVEQLGVSELWKCRFHCSGLLDGALFDMMAVIRRKASESLLESLDIEEGDWKGADATAGAADSAGNFT